MKTISDIEQEVNKIRLEIYEKTKDMTPAQIADYYRKSTDATIEKYGFRVIDSAKTNKKG